MTDYNMLYEELVLHGWDEIYRSRDPFGLGDANTMQMGGKLNNKAGHNLKFGLSSALKKLARQNQSTEIADRLEELDDRLWEITDVNEVFPILDEAKKIYKELGITITY